jgi:hypothetical protein
MCAVILSGLLAVLLCCAMVRLQVIQYAALLGPWPTHVPDGNLGQQLYAGPGSTHHLLSTAPPSPAQLDRDSTVLLHLQYTSSVSRSNISTGSAALDDPATLYRSVLHPQLLHRAAITNHSAVQTAAVVSGQHKPNPVHVGTGGDDPNSPTGQLLLWYFLGLASVQPLVLWLQAAALAVVLNVLRHMPERQLQFLLSKYTAGNGPAGIEAAVPAVGQQGMDSQHVQDGHQQGGVQDRQRPTAFMPLSYEWRGQWTLLDWLRFRLMKHSLDIVLVSN